MSPLSASGGGPVAAVLHGHAYQPPRANPWTGRVPVEPGAAPFRDWNERITAECYAPCTSTRLHDAQGRVTAIVNLFERMSFDLGPTLAHWLAEHAPVVLGRIVEADRRAHTAVAHPYHHVILPLALPRDARTELLWGIADFRHRFGREPEGMWLPETAIDGAVHRLLGELGIGFTIVAPHQVRHAPLSGHLGRVSGRDGAPLLVVYDGPASHALAFGDALGSAGDLADRLLASTSAGLAVAATDLETFGHHHRFSERAVGHLLFELAPSRGIRTGALGSMIGGVAVDDVGDVVPSAWSCAHGHDRWFRDCGCATDGSAGSHQRWRAPLRACLDVLRDHAHNVFERRGLGVFHDPWTARDAYGDVLADPDAWDDFVSQHVRPLASTDEARMLLRSQESTLASFTSCAWFFADLVRPETAIVLQEAARSAALLGALGEQAPLDRALAHFSPDGVLNGPGSREVDSPEALWNWATSERSRGAERTGEGSSEQGDLLRWDTMSQAGALVARLATEAVAGSVESARQATEVLDLVRRAGDQHLFVVAQHTVYDALAGEQGPVSSELVALGSALGLAVDAVRSLRR